MATKREKLTLTEASQAGGQDETPVALGHGCCQGVKLLKSREALFCVLLGAAAFDSARIAHEALVTDGLTKDLSEPHVGLRRDGGPSPFEQGCVPSSERSPG